ncbi:MAG: hypothetical protein KC457_18395 [Myxococcales bacterium]|nr:hypothetical protein [Myxococcales bacterium]
MVDSLRRTLLPIALIASAGLALACHRTPSGGEHPDGGQAGGGGGDQAADGGEGRFCRRAWSKSAAIPEGPIVSKDSGAAWTGDRLLVWDSSREHAASYDPGTRRWTSFEDRFPGKRVRAAAGGQLLVVIEGQYPAPLSGLLVDARSGETRPFAAPRKVLLEPMRFGEALLFSGDSWAPSQSEDLLRFEPATDRWTEIEGPLPQARIQPTVVIGERLLLRWGGQDRQDQQIQLVDGSVIDVQTMRRRLLPQESGLGSRRYPMGSAHGTRVALWGGSGDQGQLRDGAIYELESDRWQPIPALPEDLASGDDWRGVVLGETHMLVWDLQRRIASYELASGRWSLTVLPESAWTHLPGLIRDESGRAIFIGDERYGLFDPVRGWCDRALPREAVGRFSLFRAWTGEGLLLWGGITNGRSGGCENHTGPQGCDPWMEHNAHGDGWLLER